MPASEALEQLSESDEHLQWVLDQHSRSINNAGGFCDVCAGRMPCDVASLAASGLHRSAQLADRDARIAALEAEVARLKLTTRSDREYAEQKQRAEAAEQCCHALRAALGDTTVAGWLDELSGWIVEAVDSADEGRYLPAALRSEGEKLVASARAALAASGGGEG